MIVWILEVSVEVDGNIFGLSHLIGECLYIKQRAEHIEFVNIGVESASVQQRPVSHVFQSENHQLALVKYGTQFG